MGELKAIVQSDFSKGENTVTSPYLLRPEQVQQAVNVMLDEHGSLRVRDGTLIQTAPSPAPSQPICKLYDYVQVSGTVTKVAILNGPSNNTLYNRSSTPWASLGAFTKNYTLPDALTFTDLAVFSPGNQETLRFLNSANSFGSLVGAPNGCHIANHLSYLWVWNTSNISTVNASPSSLQSSDLNNANSWPSSNQTFISNNDGQSGQGLALYTIAESGISPTATIIAWKDFQGYECTGVLGAAGFAVQKIKSDMGCVAPRTIQFISGFGVIRLSHRGFALYDGVNDTLLSEEERPRIFGRDNYTGLDWNNIQYSYASQCPNPPLYVCACPVSGTTLTRWFIYDLVRRAWTVCQFANAVQTLYLPLDPNTLPIMVGGDATGGYVRRYFAGDADDDGTAIGWQILSRPAFTSPSDRAYFRRLLVKFFAIAANAQVSASFYAGPASSLSAKTQTVQVTTASTTTLGWDLDPWDTIGWGSTTGASSVTDIDLNFDIGLLANNMTVLLAGSGPARLRGLDWHVRQKPLTRSVYALQ